MRSNVITFMVIVLIIFATLAFSYDYHGRRESTAITVVEVLLVIIGLFSGYLLGSMRRRFEADGFFNQMLGQTVKRETVEKKLSLSDQRLTRQQQALSVLTQNQLKDWQNPEEIFREITKISAETIKVERVSVWLFNADNTQLECMDLYLKSKNCTR